LPKESLPFTPGFSLVTQPNKKVENRFNGLAVFAAETVKTVLNNAPTQAPG